MARRCTWNGTLDWAALCIATIAASCTSTNDHEGDIARGVQDFDPDGGGVAEPGGHGAADASNDGATQAERTERCMAASLAECAEDPECQVFEYPPVDPLANCLLPPEPYGCQPIDVLCGSPAVVVSLTRADGTCWVFGGPPGCTGPFEPEAEQSDACIAATREHGSLEPCEGQE